MGFFGQEDKAGEPAIGADDGAAITAFWSWWAAGGKAEASELFAGRGDPDRFDAFGEALGANVKALGDLAVATGPGLRAKHCLVLTAGGNPDLRPVAAAWLAAAPAPDEEFEYADHRQAHPSPESLSLRFEGGELDLASTTVLAEPEGPLVHVEVSHPKFAELDEGDRVQVTFLFLDAMLGERAVEERIGEVKAVPNHAVGASAVPLLELPRIVAAAS
ncbi:MAG: hypothetical protein M3Y20_02955 [Actinomycetota bacterium]|nr:hypothetical protein [Actinomycetota bacterium]